MLFLCSKFSYGFLSSQSKGQSTCYNTGALHDLPPFLHHSDPFSTSLLSPLQCFSLIGLPTISEHSSSFLLWSLYTYFFLWLKCTSLSYALAPHFNSFRFVLLSLLSKVFLGYHICSLHLLLNTTLNIPLTLFTLSPLALVTDIMLYILFIYFIVSLPG